MSSSPDEALEMTEGEFMWLVGILEGEGTFTPIRQRNKAGDQIYSRPRIQLQSNDKDVVERAARLLKANVVGPYLNKRSERPSFNDNPKPCWVVTVTRRDTEELLRRMLPEMSARRQEQIEQALKENTRLPIEEENPDAETYYYRKVREYLVESRGEMYAFLFALSNEQSENQALNHLVDKYRSEFPEMET